MFYRVYPTKDAFITNYAVNGVQMTGSNTGGSEILYLFKTITLPQSGSRSHILMQFDSASFPVVASASYNLNLFNCQHAETLPFGYPVYIRPVTQQWAEGSGHDLYDYTDIGNCNWNSASAGSAWDIPGGYPAGALSSTFTFDSGDEDLSVDVTNIMSTAADYGFFIQIPNALENDQNDYWIKMFYSRQSSYLWKRPYLDIKWEDWTGDTSGFSGSIDPTGSVTAIVYDLRSDYFTTEDVSLHLSVYPKNWNPAVVTTASSDVSGALLTNAYYRLVDDRTDEVVVPFGTGSTKFTKLSYSPSEGNFFRLRMGNLVPGSVYRLEFVYNSGTSWNQIRPDNQFKFRVR